MNTINNDRNQILSSDEPMLMYGGHRQIPLKTIVSTLTRQASAISDEDSEETVEAERKTKEAMCTFRLRSAASHPDFLEEEDAEAINIGTSTHRFLRLIGLDVFQQKNVDMEQAVRSERKWKKDDGALTEDESRLIQLYAIVAFLKSERGRRLLQSTEIRREATVIMRIDPRKPVMIQEIVDCAIKKNGVGILIDCKMDMGTEKIPFLLHHERQMNSYR